MSTRIVYLLAFLLLIAAGRARAQEVIQLSLKDAKEYALQHNADMKNARLDIDIQRAKNAEVTGIALPQVNGKNEFNYYAKPVVSFFPAQLLKAFDSTLSNLPNDAFVPVTFTPKFGNTATLSASQILFDGSVVVALQAKKTLLHLSTLGARATEENVRYNVQTAYYALTIAYRQREILNSSLGTARKMAADQEALRKEGFVEKIDVDRTTVQINNLSNDSLRTSNLIILSEQLLKFNMGMEINQPIQLTDTAVSETVVLAEQSLEKEISYDNRTDYNLLQDQLKLNMYDLKRYRFKALPSLSAFGTYAYTYSSNTFSDIVTPSKYVNYSLVGFQLNVPIFSGFQRTNQVKQAKLNVEKSKNNIENLKLAIDLQTAQSKSVLRNSLLTLNNASRTLELSNSIVDMANRKYKEGVGSSLEVNQAQTDLLISQNNYFQALLEVINAQSELQKARGEFK